MSRISKIMLFTGQASLILDIYCAGNFALGSALCTVQLLSLALFYTLDDLIEAIKKSK